MKSIKKMMSVLLLASVMVACESREDWYERINPAAKIYLSEVGNDEQTPNDTISVSLRFGEEKNIKYSVNDNFSLTDNYIFYYNDVEGGKFSMYQDMDNHYLRIKSLTNALEQDSKVYEYKVPVYVKDYYEKVTYALIKVTLKANQAPIPDMDYSALTSDGANGKYEYDFSAEGSSDPDGDDVVAYEYLFDGTPRKSKYAFIYETDKEGNEITNHLPSNAAYGGTYIYATKLSAVKHAFQSTGNHTVHIRCKDSQGCWSEWKEWKITIKD